MKRREFITLLGAAAWPLAARAQQPRMPVVGFLHYGSPETYVHIVSAFRQGLTQLWLRRGPERRHRLPLGQRPVRSGYRPSRPIWYNVRWSPLQLLAIVGAQAAKAATATIPVVFASGVDPVASGVVASLNRPGGNVTGVSLISLELAAKRLELLRELMPQVRVIALLINPNNPSTGTELTDAEAAARTLGLQIRKVTASNERDLDAAFATMQAPRVDALIVSQDGYYIHRRDQISP